MGTAAAKVKKHYFGNPRVIAAYLLKLIPVNFSCSMSSIVINQSVRKYKNPNNAQKDIINGFMIYPRNSDFAASLLIKTSLLKFNIINIEFTTLKELLGKFGIIPILKFKL